MISSLGTETTLFNRHSLIVSFAVNLMLSLLSEEDIYYNYSTFFTIYQSVCHY